MIKKLFIISMLLTTLSININAQQAADKIITLENRQIDCNIIEITDDAVKYKIPPYDGPMRSISIQKIHKLIYKNGTNEVLNPLYTKEEKINDPSKPVNVEPAYQNTNNNTTNSTYPMRKFIDSKYIANSVEIKPVALEDAMILKYTPNVPVSKVNDINNNNTGQNTQFNMEQKGLGVGINVSKEYKGKFPPGTTGSKLRDYYGYKIKIFNFGFGYTGASSDIVNFSGLNGNIKFSKLKVAKKAAAFGYGLALIYSTLSYSIKGDGTRSTSSINLPVYFHLRLLPTLKFNIDGKVGAAFTSNSGSTSIGPHFEFGAGFCKRGFELNGLVMVIPSSILIYTIGIQFGILF
ncbi:MAG: hypothetical protein NW207_05640 [Cytophagales bacterium]|nr:hypothetical protein [Cytophagales bacterium]